MAFTYRSDEMTAFPWLVRKIDISSTDTTAEALTHGGPAIVPDMVYPVSAAATPEALSVYSFTTTTVTCDAATGSKAAVIYCVWFSQGAGGIS
jgi:hypothetical protein